LSRRSHSGAWNDEKAECAFIQPGGEKTDQPVVRRNQGSNALGEALEESTERTGGKKQWGIQNKWANSEDVMHDNCTDQKTTREKGEELVSAFP